MSHVFQCKATQEEYMYVSLEIHVFVQYDIAREWECPFPTVEFEPLVYFPGSIFNVGCPSYW